MNTTDYKVIVIEGKQFLAYKGEKLPNQIESKVVQGINDIRDDGKSLCTITITVHALLEDTIIKKDNI